MIIMKDIKIPVSSNIFDNAKFITGQKKKKGIGFGYNWNLYYIMIHSLTKSVFLPKKSVFGCLKEEFLEISVKVVHFLHTLMEIIQMFFAQEGGG